MSRGDEVASINIVSTRRSKLATNAKHSDQMGDEEKDLLRLLIQWTGQGTVKPCKVGVFLWMNSRCAKR